MAEWSVDPSLGASIYRVVQPLSGEDESGDEDSLEGTTDDTLAANTSSRVRFDIVLPSGETLDHLILPVKKQGVLSLRSRTSPGSQLDPKESISSYRLFTSHLWSLAPEDYSLLCSILGTLESEYMLSIGADPRIFTLDHLASTLITDELCTKLVNTLMGADVLDFIEETRGLLKEMMEEGTSSHLGTLLDPEVEEVRRVDDVMSVKESVDDNFGSSLVRQPDPTGGAMQIDSGNGLENPQGSLLSTPLVDADASTGDVETSQPGGPRGEHKRLVVDWHGRRRGNANITCYRAKQTTTIKSI